jgi:hypothetical protein
MTLTVIVQLLAACFGVIGSPFFAIGIMRQSVPAMADISGTYFDFNPHMIVSIAAQKADYLFGGGFIVLAFVGQVVSLLVPIDAVAFGGTYTRLVLWGAVGGTILLFPVLRFASRRLADRYANQIRVEVKRRADEYEQSRKAKHRP